MHVYTIWLINIAMENPLQTEVFMGQSSICGPFSVAMMNNQRVYSKPLNKDKQRDMLTLNNFKSPVFYDLAS